jgi:glycosyltransferase involved in cell wall biosynthesis
MEKLTFIIPARREQYLEKTINDIFNKTKGTIEIIVTLDGHDAKRINNVKYIYNKKPQGMRTAVNQAVEVAIGKYIMKLDAHCTIDDGIDLKLINEHQDDWVQIPRRKRLDAKTWTIINDGRPDIDYMYLNNDLLGRIHGGKNRNSALKKILIDDTETFQGSCYFMTKDYFHKLGLLDDKNFGGSGNEAQEISLKCWHDGGRTIVNKNTWYAHARMNKYYSCDRTKSRKYISELARACGYEN